MCSKGHLLTLARYESCAGTKLERNRAAHAQKARTPWWLAEAVLQCVMEGVLVVHDQLQTVLRLLGIKVQFQASSTFCAPTSSYYIFVVNSFLLRGSASYRNKNVAGLIYILQGTGSSVILLCGGFMVLSDTSFPAWQLFFVSISSHFPTIVPERLCTPRKPGRLTQMPFYFRDTGQGIIWFQ